VWQFLKTDVYEILGAQSLPAAEAREEKMLGPQDIVPKWR
jgi:hypothetical protein